MRTFEELVEVLADETASSYSRRNAISSLGLPGDARAIKPLKQVLEDRSILIRREAEKNLQKIAELPNEPAPVEAAGVKVIWFATLRSKFCPPFHQNSPVGNGVFSVMQRSGFTGG